MVEGFEVMEILDLLVRSNDPVHLIIHLALGFIAGMIAARMPLSSATITVLYLVYQIDEDVHGVDAAYPDIREYGLGFMAATMILIIHKLVGHLKNRLNKMR